MTREEAIKELAELEPKEAQAWREYEQCVTLRDSEIKRHEDAVRSLRAKADELLRAHNEKWLPLYDQRRRLETFLGKPT